MGNNMKPLVFWLLPMNKAPRLPTLEFRALEEESVDARSLMEPLPPTFVDTFLFVLLEYSTQNVQNSRSLYTSHLSVEI